MQTGQTGVAAAGATPLDQYSKTGAAEGDEAAAEEEEKPLDFDEVMALVRHGKVSRLKDALAPIAKKKFDPAIVKVPYVEDFGTAYVDVYERETFNLNKVNEHGNTMLHVAAQNGNVKIAKLLVRRVPIRITRTKEAKQQGILPTRTSSTTFCRGSSTPTAAARTTRSRTCTGSVRTTGSRWSSRTGK